MEISEGANVTASVSTVASVTISISLPVEVGVGVGTQTQRVSDPYTGSYEADATFSEQSFATAGKSMLHDFNVHAINYTEAPNAYGTTVTIGG